MQAKIGESVLVVGKAIKDAEFKIVGAKDSPICSLSLNVGKRQDTTTIFANVKAWYSLAEYSRHICKGDAVIAIGHTESREYNGKTYTDLVAEWINFVGDGEASAVIPTGEVAPSGKAYPPSVKFEEVTGSESDLPF